MIPPFNDNGWLPEGVYDCTIDEAAERFGSFQGSDRRPQLWKGFTEFMGEAEASGFTEAVLVDGSFVTAKPDPNDIDLVIVVGALFDFFKRPIARTIQPVGSTEGAQTVWFLYNGGQGGKRKLATRHRLF